jgi:hypothetical protein
VFEREKVKAEEAAARLKQRELESEMRRLGIEGGEMDGVRVANGSAQEGGGKLMDELERIRGQARMRAFM